MPLPPRRLPARFNRRVSPAMRQFARRRHGLPKRYGWERVQRAFARTVRSIPALQKSLLPAVALIALGLVALAAALVLFTPLVRVREIRVIRSDTRIDIEQVQQRLAPLFGRHLFFLQRKEVEDLLTAALPDVTDVETEKRYPSTIAVRLTLDPLVATLAIVNPDGTATASGATTYDYLSENGLYLSYPSEQAGSGTYVPTITIVDWGARPVSGTRIIAPEMLMTLRRAEQAVLDQFGQPVRSRTVYLRAREFHLQTPDHALWFDRESPLEDQLERYRIFLQSVGKDAAKEYVDLRLKDRIVYK